MAKEETGAKTEAVEKKLPRFVVACTHSQVLGVRAGSVQIGGGKTSDITLQFTNEARLLWDSDKREDRSGRKLTDEELAIVYEFMVDLVKRQPAAYQFVDPKVMDTIAAKTKPSNVVVGPRTSKDVAGK